MDTETKNLIIFDMDGVIMDVSQSYRETIRLTARHFLQGAPDYDNLPDPLFSLEDLADVKQSGGLNNDWETTYRAISLLLTQVDISDALHDDDAWRLRQKIMSHCDLSNLIAFLKSHPYPLKTLLQKNDHKESGFVKKLSSGDVGSGNIIKQIFQEIYLGKKLFETIYSIPPKTDFENGLIDQEKLLVEHGFLDMLSRHHILAIATGRPKAEAAYPLNRFKLLDFFHKVLTLDDCLEEEQKRATQTGEWVSLSKPHPFMLDVIAQTFADKVKRIFYIGDMPDDMVAAQNAKAEFTGIGIISPSPDKQRLKNLLTQAGADFVIDELKELEEILLSDET
jgi:HAD superfamily hydrolase (TIGR01548 family)